MRASGEEFFFNSYIYKFQGKSHLMDNGFGKCGLNVGRPGTVGSNSYALVFNGYDTNEWMIVE